MFCAGVHTVSAGRHGLIPETDKRTDVFFGGSDGRHAGHRKNGLTFVKTLPILPMRAFSGGFFLWAITCTGPSCSDRRPTGHPSWMHATVGRSVCFVWGDPWQIQY